MIRVTYQSKDYRPSDVGVRYVRAPIMSGDLYHWCEVGKPMLPFDIRQGTCDAEDLPPFIRIAADALRGRAYGNVEWPMENKE